jgi:hypothetical protein
MTRIQMCSGTGKARRQSRPRPVVILGLSVFLALLTGLAGFAPPAPPDSAEIGADTASLETLRAEVRDQLGDPTCTDLGQCRTIPFGAKPCGGPWSYLVYSVATTDSARLADAVYRYTAREHELNRLEGRVSDCALVTEPEVICADGQCASVDGEVPGAPWES